MLSNDYLFPHRLTRRDFLRAAAGSAAGLVAANLAPARDATGPVRLGATIRLPQTGRVDEVLFGEAPSRVLVTVAPGDVERLTRIVREWAVPLHALGRVGGDRLTLEVGTDTRVTLSTEALADAFENGLARALEQPIETLSGREAEGAA